MKTNNLNTENPTQDTLGVQVESDKVLNHIIENLQEVDFKQYIESIKKKAKKTEVEVVVSENENEGTFKPTEVNSDTIELSNSLLKLKPSHYKIVAIAALKDSTLKLGFPFAEFNGSMQIYTGKKWMKLSDSELGIFLFKAIEKLGVPKLISHDVDFVHKCIKQLKLISHVEIQEVDSMGLLNFSNFTLHLNGDKFEQRAHNFKDYLNYVLPYEYDPKATCPKFEKFLKRVIPESDKKLILAEFFGSVFSKINHEKVLILYGDGANGKSVVLQIITALLGEENVSSNTLESLTDTTGYYRGELADSLLNYSGEISKKINSDQFKKLASRERTVCRLPYGKPFTISNYARLAFNCNELPDSEDTTEGFYRRFLIVHFDEFIPPEQRNKNLGNDIIKDELPGIMNWLLEGLVRLNKQQDFSKCESTSQMLDWYKSNTNTVISFKESDLFKKTIKPTKASDLYTVYTKYCEQEGLKHLGSKSFFSKLTNSGFRKVRKSDGIYYEYNEASNVG